MKFETMLNNYAKLVIQKGVSLQKGQKLLINASVETYEFVRLLVKEAYEQGAKDVLIDWQDDGCKKLRFQSLSEEALLEYPSYLAQLYNDVAESGGAYLLIHSSDPMAMSGVDAKKMAAFSKGAVAAKQPFQHALDYMDLRWCIIGVPSVAWAKRVFPEVSEEEAMSALWNAILKSARCQSEDPLQAWEQHKDSFKEKVDALNQMNIHQFHYTNNKGTDLTVGMPKEYIFEGGGGCTNDGIYHFPNIPTEEICSSPNYKDVNGIVYATLPLNFQGTLIDEFWLKFEHGVVVDYDAKIGLDSLKSILERDEGSKRLGELAFIPYTSPINNMNILFYNTLFDENASCHLALGAGFQSAIKNGVGLSDQELNDKGINTSDIHVDFMIGSQDLNIDAITCDGTTIPIFRNGEWAF